MLTKNIDRLKKFKRFLGNQVWRLFFVSLTLGVFLFLVETSFVFVLQGFLRAIGLVADDKLSLPSWYPTSLRSAVAILLTFGILRAVAYMGRTYVNGITGKAFMRLQRARIIEYSFRNIENVQSHYVMALFSERVNEASGVLQSISQIILVGTSTFLFFLTGLKLAPIEMIIGISTLSLMLIPFNKSSQSINRSGDEIRSAWEKINRVLLTGLKHNFFYKIYGLLDREIETAETQLLRYEKYNRSYYRVAALKSALPNLAGILVLSLITFISIKYIHTPGITLLSFFYLFIRLAQGASELNFSFSEFQLSMVGFKELFHWHERLIKSREVTPAQSRHSKLQPQDFLKDGISIAYKNVGFKYPDGPVLFSNLSLTVKRGEVLLLKGESGVGKSTLLMLSIGMLEPSSGSIEINGVPVSEVTNLLFDSIAYVGPEAYMVSGTLRENLLYGHHEDRTVTDAEMLSALERAQLSDKRLPLDLFINEQTQLSTGQKQRIAIARAILRKPKLLILDEATANLDAATESNFIDSVSGLFKEITTLVISHKASFDQIANQKIELKKTSN